MGFKDPLRYMEDGMPGAEEVRFQSALLIISKGDRDGFPVTFLSSQTFMP